MGGVDAVLGQDVIDMSVEEEVAELVPDAESLEALTLYMRRIDDAEIVAVS